MGMLQKEIVDSKTKVKRQTNSEDAAEDTFYPVLDYEIYDNANQTDSGPTEVLKFFQKGIVSFGEQKKCGDGGRPGKF